MTTTHDHEHDDIFDRGLAFDLETARAGMGRRRALKLFGLGAVALVGCAKGATTAATSGSSTTATTAGSSSSSTGGPGGGGMPSSSGTTAEGAIPEETAGPYPGDGSNGPNVLVEDGIVRSDIRSSFGDSTNAAPEGVPLDVVLTVTDRTTGEVKPGAAVYLWHCDTDGKYSMYSSGVEDENWLRGVQEADGDGQVTFTTWYPACYDGRWPHIHFEVYASLAEATAAGDPVATSQLAMPDEANTAVFATSAYSASVSNYSRVSLSTDNVFSDGADQETPTMTGDASSGYTAALTVPV